MKGAPENGRQPIRNVEGDVVALGPLRRDLLPLYTRWINDLGAARTLGAFLPMTLEGETKWYDESATSEKTVPFTVYARPTYGPSARPRSSRWITATAPPCSASLSGTESTGAKATVPRPPASCSTTPSRCWACTTSC